jgi:cytochrome c553
VETSFPVQLWIDVDELGNVKGVLSIYPNYPEIPQAALSLIQQNGCNVPIESLSTPSITGFFYSETQARIHVNVAECNVKFYGPVVLPNPLRGEFNVAYDAELTDLIRRPRELTPIERGLRVFVQYCSACHGSHAEGMPGIPSLHTDQVRNYTDEQLDSIIRNGVVNTVMPAWGNVLSPEDFAGVIELIRNIDEVLGE